MRSLLLTSILVATLVIPMAAARDPNARRGLHRALFGFGLYSALYSLACAYVYYRLP